MSTRFENFDKAYMNALTQLHQSCSCNYIKKPVQVDAEQTLETKIIHTLEGDVVANPTDWIITGIEGEQYPIKDEEFKNIYERLDNGRFRKKPIKVSAWQTDKELLLPHGESNLKASIGDYIVKQPDGYFTPVKPDIFNKTYDKYEQ